MRRTYLDHASQTPADPRVLRIMARAHKALSGNPSALHQEGRKAAEALAEARAAIAKILGLRPREAVFTGSGTEACALAVRGTVSAATRDGFIPHVVVSSIEHAAVLETARALAASGTILFTELPVTPEGLVDPKVLRDALRPETVLVAVQYANNEIGSIQPVGEVAKAIRHFKRSLGRDAQRPGVYPLFFVDGAQAMNLLDPKAATQGADLFSCNGSKAYGPRGIGLLAFREGTPIVSIMDGGDQEFGLRPGTEDVARIVGFAEAISIAQAKREKEYARLSDLQQYAYARLAETVPEAVLNGTKEHRLPGNINIAIPGVDSDALVLYLDARGVAVSAKSACKSDDPGVSHVLSALGLPESHLRSSIRATMGRDTKKRDIDRFVRALRESVDLLS